MPSLPDLRDEDFSTTLQDGGWAIICPGRSFLEVQISNDVQAEECGIRILSLLALRMMHETGFVPYWMVVQTHSECGCSE